MSIGAVVHPPTAVGVGVPGGAELPGWELRGQRPLACGAPGIARVRTRAVPALMQGGRTRPYPALTYSPERRDRMAQIEKYTLQQAKAIIAHCERTGATHSNESIDPERTKDNYSLWPPADPDKLQLDTEVPGQSSARYAYQRLTKRLSEVKCLQRDDVNVLCDWCLHLGVDVPPGYESKRAFYEAAVQLMAKLYGEKNVVYAWVHEDETSSHIHFGFVPVVRKELKLRKNASERLKAEYEAAIAAGKTTIERVDANALINRKHLKGWHGWMTKHITSELGYDPGMHTGVTQFLGGNATVPQLKKTGPNWRAKRNAKVNAFHEHRRAQKAGERSSLASQIGLATPDKPQAVPERPNNQERKQSLFDQMKDASEKSGGGRW